MPLCETTSFATRASSSMPSNNVSAPVSSSLPHASSASTILSAAAAAATHESLAFAGMLPPESSTSFAKQTASAMISRASASSSDSTNPRICINSQFLTLPVNDADADRANSVEIEVSVAQRSAGPQSNQFSQSASFVSGRCPPIASSVPSRAAAGASSRGIDPNSETLDRFDALKIGHHQRVAPSIAALESLLEIQHLQLFSQGFISEAPPSSLSAGRDNKQAIPDSRFGTVETSTRLHRDQHALASSGTVFSKLPN